MFKLRVRDILLYLKYLENFKKKLLYFLKYSKLGEFNTSLNSFCLEIFIAKLINSFKLKDTF